MSFGWPLTSAAQYESLGSGTGEGTTVAGGNNTKGTYATIGTSSFNYDGLFLTISSKSGSNRFRIDVAINTGGSDQIIAADLYCDLRGSTQGCQFNLPVRVPSGAAVKVSALTFGSALNIGVVVLGYRADDRQVKGFSKCISCTDWSSTDPTNSITCTSTSLTGWMEITSGIANQVAALMPSVCNLGSATPSVRMLIDIAFGASGAERVLLPKIHIGNNSGSSLVLPTFPVALPAGTRLAARFQAHTTYTQSISLVLNGLVP